MKTLPQIAKLLGVPEHRVRFAVKMANLEPTHVLSASCFVYDPDAVKVAMALVGTRKRGRSQIEREVTTIADLIARPDYWSHKTVTSGNIGFEYADRFLLTTPEKDGKITVLDTSLKGKH